MTVETATCGRCGDRVPLDTDHGEVIIPLCFDCVIQIDAERASPVGDG